MATVAVGLGQFQRFLSCDIGTGLYTCYLGMKSETEVSQPFATLCNHMDCRLPDFSVHGILQARVPRLSFLSPRDFPNPGMEPGSPALQADTLPSEPPGKTLVKGSTMILFSK